MFAIHLLCFPGHVTAKYNPCWPDDELLACNDSDETPIEQQASVRELSRLVARLTATGDAFYPQCHHQQRLCEDS